MSIGFSPPVPSQAGAELLAALKRQLTMSLLEGDNVSILWRVGSSWLRYEHGTWLIDADNPATEDEVRELLAMVGERPIRYP